jgi:hypothetical protein
MFLTILIVSLPYSNNNVLFLYVLDNMKRLKSISLLLGSIFIASMVLSSCATGNQARKCDGRKAIRTPMGPM